MNDLNCMLSNFRKLTRSNQLFVLRMMRCLAGAMTAQQRDRVAAEVRRKPDACAAGLLESILRAPVLAAKTAPRSARAASMEQTSDRWRKATAAADRARRAA